MWATQQEIADAFECSIKNVSLHISTIYSVGELDEIGTMKKNFIVQKEGSRLCVGRSITIILTLFFQ